MKGRARFWVTVCILAFLAFTALGFYKMFAYNNPKYTIFEETQNAYVEGDAYNYIINGTYATAYFVLAGAMLLTACGVHGLAILEDLRDRMPKQTPAEQDPSPLEG